jgi:hypothetical protein
VVQIKVNQSHEFRSLNGIENINWIYKQLNGSGLKQAVPGKQICHA